MSRSTLVYIAVGLCAIGAVIFATGRGGDGAASMSDAPLAHDPAALQARLEGSMKKLRFHSDAQAVSQTPYTTADGGSATLADHRGRYVLLNFWATWCAPCRKEMPMLSQLQTEFGGESFEVVTIATGRNPPPAMAAFFEQIGVGNLPLHRDPKQVLARDMGVMGLPVTIIIDPQGREIARMLGDAEWTSDSARTMLGSLLGTMQQ